MADRGRGRGGENRGRGRGEGEFRGRGRGDGEFRGRGRGDGGNFRGDRGREVDTTAAGTEAEVAIAVATEEVASGAVGVVLKDPKSSGTSNQ
jgi:hypothetical protein